MSIVIRELPCFDPQKENLPRRSNFIGALSWLRAIQKCLGDSFVFALDESSHVRRQLPGPQRGVSGVGLRR